MHNERIDPSTTQDVQEQEEQEDFKALVVEMVPVKWSITTKYKRTPVICGYKKPKNTTLPDVFSSTNTQQIKQ